MSIADSLDSCDVINSIRLQLRHPSGENKLWIVVEGPSDQKLYKKLINADHVEIEISTGVEKLKKSISELLNETKYILGICDADFMHLESRSGASEENIFYTDFHDVEMMLVSCDKVFNSVTREYLSEEPNPIGLRDTILKSICFLGGVRWVNHSESLKLNFKNFNLGQFYDGNTIKLDEDKCILEVLKRSPQKRGSLEKESVKSKISGKTDFFNLCNGHDFLKAVSIVITSKSKQVSHETIESAFRIAYDIYDFQQSKLYSFLKKWSDNVRTLFK